MAIKNEQRCDGIRSQYAGQYSNDSVGSIVNGDIHHDACLSGLATDVTGSGRDGSRHVVTFGAKTSQTSVASASNAKWRVDDHYAGDTGFA